MLSKTYLDLQDDFKYCYFFLCRLEDIFCPFINFQVEWKEKSAKVIWSVQSYESRRWTLFDW